MMESLGRSRWYLERRLYALKSIKSIIMDEIERLDQEEQLLLSMAKPNEHSDATPEQDGPIQIDDVEGSGESQQQQPRHEQEADQQADDLIAMLDMEIQARQQENNQTS